MATSRQSLGGIVALDGHDEMVTTQLRLLPTSPQIMVLPEVQCYMQQDGNGGELTVPALIRNAHEALKERTKSAKAFLSQSTEDNKRLVFMKGSTSSAKALCLRSIMDHHTDGDSREAEEILNHVVQEGLSGLEKHWLDWQLLICQQTKPFVSEDMVQEAVVPPVPEVDDASDDPITKAMRAADALDRETENLQESNELDLTTASRPRCSSLPLYGYSDGINDAAPFFVFGAQSRSPTETTRKASVDMLLSPMSSKFAVTHYDQPSKGHDHHGMSDMISPKWTGEMSSPPTGTMWSPTTHEYFTPQTTIFDPRSPDTSIFRDHSLFEGAAPGGLCPPPTHQRIRSLDRMFPNAPKYGDVGIDEDASSPTAVATPTPRVETFGYKSRSAGSWMLLEDGNDTLHHHEDAIQGSQVITVRPQRATIIFDPVPKDKKCRRVRSVYVDKGTDAETLVAPKAVFEPVFVVEEDLIIYIKDEATDMLLDQSFRGFRDASYPDMIPQDEVESETTPTQPKASETDLADVAVYELEAPVTIASPPMDAEEYDPFAYTRSVPTVPKPTTKVHVSLERPPTPEMTPTSSTTPSIAEKQEKFRQLIVSSDQTAVTIQNSLRSLLNGYFPREAHGYRQFQFSLLPELDGLWEPIFRQAEPGSPRKDNRRVDQIIAIGSQTDVKRDYSMAITGQLERLGSKSSGLSRSGRLDFRYLLANAMQRFTMQPLAKQIDNPFNNPYLLATLLVPELETYLALHREVRYLLLEYPPEHLATAISLQQLIGVDTMKIAYIVDSRTSRLPFTHIRGASIDNKTPTLGKGGQQPSPPPPPQPKHAHWSMSDVHISKANFLLTSRASEAHIATFLSTVAKVLAEISDFYIPEKPPTPKKPSTRKQKPAPLQSAFSSFPKQDITVPTTPTSPSTPVPGASTRHATPPQAPSIPDTTRTTRSSRTRGQQRARSKSRSSKFSRRTKQTDAMSMYTFDPAEDSDYDVEEKRLMPLFLQKPKKRKGDSQKALKFLGLA